MTAWSQVARQGPHDALLITADPLLRDAVVKIFCHTFSKNLRNNASAFTA